MRDIIRVTGFANVFNYFTLLQAYIRIITMEAASLDVIRIPARRANDDIFGQFPQRARDRSIHELIKRELGNAGKLGILIEGRFSSGRHEVESSIKFLETTPDKSIAQNTNILIRNLIRALRKSIAINSNFNFFTQHTPTGFLSTFYY